MASNKAWDRGLDYEFTYNKLLRVMRKSGKPGCYAQILLIQLRNGARIGEAVEAWKEFYRTGKSELQVRVEKKKKNETRLIIVPSEVERREECFEFVEVPSRALKKRVIQYALDRLGFNTHSLRYAFITYLLRQGVNPSIVAKITKHSNLN
ncbi:MAG: hypothetical protein ACP5IE_01335, partial [Infirmifilum sp.]